jgi:hypothetical protein
LFAAGRLPSEPIVFLLSLWTTRFTYAQRSKSLEVKPSISNVQM